MSNTDYYLWFTLVQEPVSFTRFCNRVKSSLSSQNYWYFSSAENGHNLGSWLLICQLQKRNLPLLGLILSKRKFIYIGYEIMKMKVINNATKLKAIFVLEDWIFEIIFYISFHLINLLKRNISKNWKKIFSVKDFYRKIFFLSNFLKFQMNFVEALGLPRR